MGDSRRYVCYFFYTLRFSKRVSVLLFIFYFYFFVLLKALSNESLKLRN